MLSILYILFMTIAVVSSMALAIHVIAWACKYSTGKNVMYHVVINIVLFLIAIRLGENVLGLI